MVASRCEKVVAGKENSASMRHLIDITDLSNDEIELLADTADRIIADRAAFSHACAGKKLDRKSVV